VRGEFGIHTTYAIVRSAYYVLSYCTHYTVLRMLQFGQHATYPTVR
jgi:hypothetical protein